MKPLVSVAFAILSFLHVQAASAETDLEQRIRTYALEHPHYSTVFMDARLIRGGSPLTTCRPLQLTASSNDGKRYEFVTQFMPDFGSNSFGAVSLLPAGTYVVTQVECGGWAQFRLNGKFARFLVRPDETINAGALVVDFKYIHTGFFEGRKSTGRTSVEDLGKKAVDSLNARAPVTFRKATKRYLVPMTSAQ